jgi:four helix bundle protein
MRDHRRLEAFQLADALAMRIYAVTKTFPGDERFGLTSQLRRAAVSVGTNIVEGSARRSLGDYIRFLTVAFSSARELEYELSIANRLGYLDPPASTELQALATRTCAALFGLIGALSTKHDL